MAKREAMHFFLDPWIILLWHYPWDISVIVIDLRLMMNHCNGLYFL